jgi:hypothetical protein
VSVPGWPAARFLAPALAFALVSIACSGTTIEEATGVVVDVTGDITTVERFAIQTADGERLELLVAPGVVFGNGAPVGHLSEHLQTGEPVVVRYEVLDDGSRVVQELDDA